MTTTFSFSTLGVDSAFKEAFRVCYTIYISCPVVANSKHEETNEFYFSFFILFASPAHISWCTITILYDIRRKGGHGARAVL